MHTFTVCFFGHRYIHHFSLAEKRVDALIHSLIQSKEYVEFLVGREGDFDQIVSSSIIQTKEKIFAENSNLTWVLPYPKADLLHFRDSYEQYYDSIEICEASEKAYPKAAIEIRNRHMIDRSELCVFFVEHNSGGAWKAMMYAKRQKKNIINLADSELK